MRLWATGRKKAHSPDNENEEAGCCTGMIAKVDWGLDTTYLGAISFDWGFGLYGRFPGGSETDDCRNEPMREAIVAG
jgi:hypothetical protein